MHLIDESTAIRPAMNSTWFIALFLSLVNRFTSSRLPHAEKKGSSVQNGGTTTTTNDDVKPNVDSDDGSSSDAPDSEAQTSKRKGESRVKMPTVKAGGMRRKNLRKR
jgi:DnaJ homolog subfamily C member 1